MQNEVRSNSTVLIWFREATKKEKWSARFAGGSVVGFGELAVGGVWIWVGRWRREEGGGWVGTEWLWGGLGLVARRAGAAGGVAFGRVGEQCCVVCGRRRLGLCVGR